MTVSQLHKQRFPKKFLILGLIPIFCGVFILIMLYNKTVDVQHSIASKRSELQSIEGDKAALNDRLLTLFSRQHIEIFAHEHGLLEDRNPRYLLVEKTQTWEVASQY